MLIHCCMYRFVLAVCSTMCVLLTEAELKESSQKIHTCNSTQTCTVKSMINGHLGTMSFVCYWECLT